MPLVYRVKHDGNEERTATFFAKKGDATRFKRENKAELNADDVEPIKLQGRDDLCAALNNPYTFGEEGSEPEDDNEFI